MIKRLTLITSVVIAGLITGQLSQPIFAAHPPSNGLAVSPAINSIQAASGQTSATFDATITNITTTQVAVAISTKDFGSLNEYGNVGFYGASYKSANNSHSLASSIVLPSTEYLLNPHQSQTIQVSIDNITQLAPGGHYSALLFTPFIARNGHVTNEVSIQPSVASLIFLTTASGGYQSIKLTALSLSRVGFSLPSTVYLNLYNDGNTQTIPRGTLSLYDPTGKLVTQSVINSNSGLILPSSSRLFTQSLVTSNNIFKLAGEYKIKITYQVNGSPISHTTTKSFLYINPIIFIYLVIIILIIWLVVRIRKKTKKIKKEHQRAKEV